MRASLLTSSIVEGKLKNHPAKVMPGGFPGILEGLEMIRRKEVSGFKLVYEVD